MRTRVEVLLNTLEGERYVRRALVEELIDVLREQPFAALASCGQDLLRSVSDDRAFAASLRRFRAELASVAPSTQTGQPGAALGSAA